MKKKHTLYLIILITGLIVLTILSAGSGAMKIAPFQVISIFFSKMGINLSVSYDSAQENIFWIIRMPRILLAVLIGAGLSVSGAALQGLFRNPLADPGLIGISSGASLCAVMAIVMMASLAPSSEGSLTGFYALNIFTFIGACASSVIVYFVSKSGGKTIITTMLLAGIAMNAICNALMGLIIFQASDTELRNITFWLLGSLGGASWDTVLAVLPFILLPVIFLPRLSKELNIFSLGETEASYVGVNVDRLKTKVIILSTMAVGASVAVAGIIGFVGLVIPHIVRMVAGPDQRFTLIASSLFGAILLTVADTLSRIVVAPAELPIGIVTAIVGVPIFVWILVSNKKYIKII